MCIVVHNIVGLGTSLPKQLNDETKNIGDKGSYLVCKINSYGKMGYNQLVSRLESVGWITYCTEQR